MKSLKSYMCNTVLLDFQRVGEQWESIVHRQPTYSWVSMDSAQHSLTTYHFAPLVSSKKHTQMTTFKTLSDTQKFLSEHKCALPYDYERNAAWLTKGKVVRQRHIVVHEPMLSTNSVEVFLERIHVLTEKAQTQICTNIPLDNDVDTTLFILELVRAVFDTKKISSDSLLSARKNTMTHNLAAVEPAVTPERLQDLCDIVEEATVNKDADIYREELHDALRAVLSSTAHTKQVQFQMSPSYSLLPNSKFGVVQFQHHVSSTLDYTLQELVDVFTIMSVATTDHSIIHQGIRHLYEDKIIPLFTHTSVNDESSLSLTDLYLRAQLSQDTQELLLFQIFQQLDQDEACPLFAIWNDDAVVKRQLFQLRYHEAHLGIPPRVLHAYTKYVIAHDSSMKIVEDTERSQIATMDFVLVVNEWFYLFTLTYDGQLTFSPRPIGNASGKPNEEHIEVLLESLVADVLPVCNAFLRRITDVLYLQPHFSNVSPRLFDVYIKYNSKTRCVKSARNVCVASYVASYSENTSKQAIGDALETLQHAIVPASLSHGDNTTIQKCITKNIKDGGLQKYCLTVLCGTNYNEVWDAQWLKTNSTLTPLLSHLVSRYHLSSQTAHPYLNTLSPLRMTFVDDEVKITLQTETKKQYLKHISVHPHSFVTFIALFAHILRLHKSHSTASSSSLSGLQCPIPYIPSHSDVVLKNMEHIFKSKYVKHKNTAQAKNKYANVCQRPKQPWCVTAPHVHNMRRWCRYACISAEFDYWKVKSYRDFLDLTDESMAVFNGPFASKYMNLKKTHNELVHNYCRLIKLTMCKTTHHIVSNTFKQLIVAVSELIQDTRLDTKAHTLKMFLNNAYDYETYPKVLRVLVQILKEAYPDDEYNADFEQLPSWAKIFYAVCRFAELFVYLQHPNEKTNTGEDIYYCSPIYVCTHCKTPISNPESPAYYYADPVQDADIDEALHYGHKMYHNNPIVEASCRLKSTSRTDGHYAYGDIGDTHMEDLRWMCVPPNATAAPPPTRRVQHTSPYAPFGRLVGLQDHHKQTPGSALLVNIQTVFYSLKVDNHDPTRVVAQRWTHPVPAKAKSCGVMKLYVDVGATEEYHLTEDCPHPSWKLATSAKLRPTIHCTLHKVRAYANPTHRQSRCKAPALKTYAVLYNDSHSVTVFHRVHYPLCLRFQQRRAYDPLKCLHLSTKHYKKNASSIDVTLKGCVQFETKRVQKKHTVRSKATRTRKTARLSPTAPGTEKGTENVSTYTAPLATLIRNNVIRVVHHTHYVELHLEWHYCRSWMLKLPNKWVYEETVELNHKRKTTVYPDTGSEHTENSFPHTQLSVHPVTCSVTAFLNDDTHFRCPICNQSNQYRTFRDKERSAYGSIVGIVKPETNVNLDPNWLYVCSFKLLGARIDSSAYINKWKANPKLNPYQYSIPLQERVNFSSLRTKTFNCGVLKVTTLDTFSLSSLNLDSFFEQPSTLSDTSFIMTGCKKPGSTDIFRHQLGSIQQLWQLAIEKEVTPEWLGTVITPDILLNAEKGHFVHQRRQDDDLTHCNPAMASQWLKRHQPLFQRSASTFKEVCKAYAYLQNALSLDANLLNTFHLFWHIMTCVGYQLGQQQFSVYYFFFDVVQTPSRKNFKPSLVCPPNTAHTLYWNPYQATVDNADIRTHADILLFTMGVKMHCQEALNDTFYLLRRNKIQLHNQYVQVCYKSRVQFFCDKHPRSLQQAMGLYNALKPLVQESEQMFVNAYFYYKLFNHVSKCDLNKWTPDIQNALEMQYVATADVLTENLPAFQRTNEYMLHPYVLQPTSICMLHKKEQKYLILSVSADCDSTMKYVDTKATLPLLSFDTVVSTLTGLANALPSYAPHYVMLNTVSQVIGVKLSNGGQVPVSPILYTNAHTQLAIFPPYTYNTLLLHSRPEPVTNVSYMDVWEHFIDICDALSIKCKQQPHINIYPQLQKYVSTVSKSHRRQVLELVHTYGESPTIQNFIRTQSTQALRSYIIGIYSHHLQTRTTRQFYFSNNQQQHIFYDTEHRSTGDILYHNILLKKSNWSGNTSNHQAVFLHRTLPPPYNRMLRNTRILNANGLKELIHTKNLSKDVTQLSQSHTVLCESAIVPFLYRPIYILNEQRFLEPPTTGKNKIALENSIVFLTRLTAIRFDAQCRTSCLSTHQLPPCFIDIYQAEASVHVLIYHNQAVHPARVVKCTKKSNAHELVLKTAVDIPEEQSVHVHLNADKHCVKHYELLKHRVDDRLKNLQFEQLPESLRVCRRSTKAKDTHKRYIRIN